MTRSTVPVHYGVDWTRHWKPAPSDVLFPESAIEVQEIVVRARSSGSALVPSGGRTGLSGGAVAADGEIVVSMERMRTIAGFDPVDRSVVVQAGVTTQAVQEFAREQGLYYPVDFGSRGSSQIGGNIATNAGGIKVLRYGMTRNWVTGLKVVTGTGELLDLNRGLVKNATGYDLRHLFIGSEGTLGIIVEATLQLISPPPPQQVMLLAVPRLEALMDVFAEVRSGLVLSAFEFFTDRALAHVRANGARDPFDRTYPYYVIVEFDADEAEMLLVFERLSANGLIADGILSQSDAQAAELWRLREGITESLAQFRPYKNDIAVRVSQVPLFLTRVDSLFAIEYPSFEVIWFGHIGDGNLHISVLPAAGMSRERFEEDCERVTHLLGALLAECGGTISAEHGVGLLKKHHLHYTRPPAEVDLMRQMKRIFDPAGILNPGKIFDA